MRNSAYFRQSTWILTPTLHSRPKTIDDVSAQDHTVAVLRKTLTSTNVGAPWIALVGNSLLLATAYALLRSTRNWKNIHHPSIGTTTVWVRVSVFLLPQTFLRTSSPDNFRNRVLELNASDERGINIVREKIKNFARQTPRAKAVSSDGIVYPCPPYKIIILDEADSMTQDAQGALRRIMETYARITRFCLVCNYVTRCVPSLCMALLLIIVLG